MSKKNKLQRFADLLEFPNVYENFNPKTNTLIHQPGAQPVMKGQWHQHHFENNHPITLELACGKGEYTLGLARRYPNRNIIGVDIKGARIWKGAKAALEEQLPNAAFLRTRIELIGNFFEKGEVDEVWIVFPDPFLKKENRRLTSPTYLSVYRKILRPGSIVQLKTDDPTLYEYTLETLEGQSDFTLLYQKDDIYAEELYLEELSIKTFYEQMHLKHGKAIKYVRFKWEG